MDIAILVFDGVTPLDAVGPYEVLARLPGAAVALVAEAPGPVRSGDGGLTLVAEAGLAGVADPDIVVVAGGPGQVALMDRGPVHEWLRACHERTTWTASVCTGSLILGAAGLLRGVRATSHWLALDALRRLGAVPVAERVVVDGRIVTAAGVSAGIDMALLLAAHVAGEDTARTIQLSIEYDPQPPFDAGSPATAPAAAVDFLRERSRFRAGA